MPLLFEKYVHWYKKIISNIMLNEILIIIEFSKKKLCSMKKKILCILLIWVIAIVKLWKIMFFKIFISFTDFLNY